MTDMATRELLALRHYVHGSLKGDVIREKSFLELAQTPIADAITAARWRHPRRIGQIQRIVSYVRIQIEVISVPHRIRLQKPPYHRSYTRAL